jgi:hypothetical protein
VALYSGGNYYALYLQYVTGTTYYVTTTANSNPVYAYIPQNAIASSVSITSGSGSATTTVTPNLYTTVSGSPVDLGWTFQVRAYFNKWLIVSRD